MPAGGGVIGFAAFAAVKLAGYTLAARALDEAYKSPTNIWKVGATRTAIGLTAGTAYWGLSTLLPNGFAEFVWFIGLLPIRFAEWGGLIRLFYDSTWLGSAKSWKYSTLGTAWSYVLDAVGVLAAFVVPGGLWIC